MTMTYATITGTITKPDSDVGVTGTLVAVPGTRSAALRFSAEGRTTLGSAVGTMDEDGTVSIQIPLNSNIANLVWRFVVTPKGPYAIPWELGYFEITEDADISVLDSVEITKIPSAPTLASVLTEIQDLHDEVVAVGSTNDTIIAGRVNDAASATAAALSASLGQQIETDGTDAADAVDARIEEIVSTEIGGTSGDIGSALAAHYAGIFDPTKAYVEDTIVVNPFGEIAQAIADTPAGAYDSLDWTILNGAVDLMDMDPIAAVTGSDLLPMLDDADDEPKKVTATQLRDFVATNLYAKLNGQIKRTGYAVGWAATTTTGLVDGRMQARPLVLSKGATFATLKVNVTTLGAGSTIRVGIYANDPDTNLPGALLADLGTQASTTTGVKTFVYTGTIPDETIVWVAVVSQGGTPSSVRVTEEGHRLLPADASLTAGVAAVYLTAGGVTGALPDPFGTGLSVISRMPAVAFQ